ncbi:hypothetical protein DM01DRAFT_1378729 [Hesseltinella vesiculosa]|uniref:Uncharacterized protein n=1 Tax=Hesseltinella vesiculosa TaxID=101127 RepID=A0A1X2G4D1_9FUNG|nr:hypothetical protein DM01DRAFT_1378729 [Hesseltinella vesiculosa]
MEYERRRKVVDYGEQNQYLPIQFHKTSNWDRNIVEIMKITDDEWKSPINIKELALSPEYKTLVLELKRFNYYPLSISFQHKFEIKIGDDVCLTSIPDFVVMSEESKMLIIVEDNNMKNGTNFNQWKESQLIGEIFTAIHAMKIEQDMNLYAIRIIVGPKPPTQQGMSVYRYPDPGNKPNSITALDFCKAHDRKIILQYFAAIKNEF